MHAIVETQPETQTLHSHTITSIIQASRTQNKTKTENIHKGTTELVFAYVYTFLTLYTGWDICFILLSKKNADRHFTFFLSFSPLRSIYPLV